MSQVTVRPFVAGDEPAVAALWGRVFPDDRPWNAPMAIVRRKLGERDGLFWVALADGRVAGALLAGYDGQRGWLYHLAVAPEHRRQGIGRALVDAAETALSRRGCPKVNLQVLPAGRDVVGFYERLGYAIEERVSMGKALASHDGGPAGRPRDEPLCSFCGRRRYEVRKLIAGPAVLICERCVAVCNDIIATEGLADVDASPGRGPAPSTEVCRLCHRPKDATELVVIAERGPLCTGCVDVILATSR